MDKGKIKQFIVPLLIVIVALVATLNLGIKVYNGITQVIENKQTLTTKSQELEEKKQKLEKLRKDEAAEARKTAEIAAKSKPFYKAPISGMNTEALIAGEFTEILELIRANKIKVRSMKYDYDPQDDNFVKNAGGTYKAARLNMEMVASYTSLNNFLKELYKHEHFLDIQSVEVVPYRKNKQILLVNFKIKLYSSEK